MTMSRSLKSKWVKALESGHYRQSRNYLRSVRKGRPTYCCLGVLCRVAGYKFTISGIPSQGGEAIPKADGGALGAPLLNIVGLTTRQQFQLIDTNDKEKKNFKQIAAWIRKNIKVKKAAKKK